MQVGFCLIDVAESTCCFINGVPGRRFFFFFFTVCLGINVSNTIEDNKERAAVFLFVETKYELYSDVQAKVAHLAEKITQLTTNDTRQFDTIVSAVSVKQTHLNLDTKLIILILITQKWNQKQKNEKYKHKIKI